MLKSEMASALADQYADGKAAQVWQKYIGDQNQRTGYYKKHLLSILREHNVQTVFDVACGTGVDSILLLEEGFKVSSCDASDQMLKHAYKSRWMRRKEEAFSNWEIEEGNWLHLKEAAITIPPGGFDALICMGNSFAHLPDFDGSHSCQLSAIQNFYDMLKPGGILIIDHRNYDHIVAGGKAPMENIYYQSQGRVDCRTSVLMIDGKYEKVILDYCMYLPGDEGTENTREFRLSMYPHLWQNFERLIKRVFGDKSTHTVLGDFKPLDSENKLPSYYIHVCQKS